MYSLQLIVKSESVEDLKKEIVRVLNVLNNTEDVPDIPGIPGNPTPKSVDHKTETVPTFQDLDEEDIPEQIQETEKVETVSIKDTLPVAPHRQDVDSEGLPWDGRIHSASKTFNKDGTWRLRRNVDIELVKKVKEELKPEGKTMQVNVPPVAQVPSVPLVSNVVPQAPISTPVTTPPVVQQPPVQPVYENIQVPQSTKPAHSFQTFKTNVVSIMAQFLNEKKIDQNYMNLLKEHFKVQEVFEIFDDDDKLMQLFLGFVEHGYITKVD